jgi:asparagine synthase (glutamine-hydrolysing)
MCGIAGIVNLTHQHPPSIDLLKRMIGVMQYRGPDESGVYCDDWAGLCHARLSIIDLAGGSQPLCNEDGNLWIVYNGEIYNYRELRIELEQRGHHFKTASDTEVIIHAYEEKGEACLNDFNGQFAFAIWDSRTKELFLARDRVGVRPLHYAVCGNRLLFGSEIKSIFMSPEILREIDPVSLDQVFTFWTTLPGRTMFKNIKELLPGHWLKISSGNITIKKYWEIPLFPKSEQRDDMSPGQIGEEIQTILADSVRLRLRADVPVGTYLSGGLDSSGVSALVVRELGNNIHTFGIRFEEAAFDEGPFQKEMSSFLNTRHHELQSTNESIGAAFSDVVWHCEKPLLRTAPVPLYLLSKLVAEMGIKVVLTGEASDEFFGGYDIFKEANIRRFWARQPDSRFRQRLIGKLYPDIFKNPILKKTLPAFFARNIQDINDPFYSHRIRWNNTGRAKQFFSKELKDIIGNYRGINEIADSLPADYSKWDGLNQSQYLEIHIFLSNYLLSSQGDRVAMAHSVEIRLPFLDHRLMEFAGRIPSKWKILGMNEKHVLKKSFKGILPDSIISRVKHPYRAPIHHSLLHTKSGEFHRALLDEKHIDEFGLFDGAMVSRFIKKLDTGVAGEVDGMALAGILSMQILFQKFVAQFAKVQVTEPVLSVLVDKRTTSERNS